MNERMDERMNEGMNEWWNLWIIKENKKLWNYEMNQWMNNWLNEKKGWMNEVMLELINEWMSE